MIDEHKLRQFLIKYCHPGHDDFYFKFIEDLNGVFKNG